MDKCSKKQNIYYGIILIFISSLFTAIGQLFWKLSNGCNISFLFFGFFCYGIGAITMIVAFRFGKLSTLHPLLSLGYVISLVIGNIYLGEKITYYKVFGVILIIIGVVLIGGSNE